MNEVVMLHQISPAGMLQEMMKENIPLFMSVFYCGRWQVNRVLVLDVRADTFDITGIDSSLKDRVQWESHFSLNTVRAHLSLIQRWWL